MEGLEEIIHIILYISIVNIIISVINSVKLSQIEMTNEELITQLGIMNTKVDKIKGEIQALKDAVANADNVPQAVIDATNQLATNLQAADDLNPDAPPATP